MLAVAVSVKAVFYDRANKCKQSKLTLNVLTLFHVNETLFVCFCAQVMKVNLSLLFFSLQLLLVGISVIIITKDMVY